jgi:hypothetical protein
MKLTPAQRDALALLAKHPDEWLEGWKRSTGTHGRPRVNMRAAHALVRHGLARSRLPNPALWSPYTHDSKYQITATGRAEANR